MSTTTPHASLLLAWYDRHRRHLPWRALPGERVDPYRVWLSEIMLQQTTVAAVKPYFEKFVALWPTVTALAASDDEPIMKAWAGLGYYSRARNLHACAKIVVERHAGLFPSDETALRALPGIGDYTAAAIRSIAFGLPAVVVDGNVERVVSRLNRIGKPVSAARPLFRAAAAAISPTVRPGDFAQAMMDLGATICTPKNPACILCPLTGLCAARTFGDMDQFPVKLAKATKPTRRGAAFVALAGNSVLLRRRAPEGLLGGMTEFPGTDWIADADLPDDAEGAPLDADWHNHGAIRHVFTHFTLELTVFVAHVREQPFADGRWTQISDLHSEALPTVMRKVAALGLTPRRVQP